LVAFSPVTISYNLLSSDKQFIVHDVSLSLMAKGFVFFSIEIVVVDEFSPECYLLLLIHLYCKVVASWGGGGNCGFRRELEKRPGNVEGCGCCDG
jgi:hypothetical protein